MVSACLAVSNRSNHGPDIFIARLPSSHLISNFLIRNCHWKPQDILPSHYKAITLKENFKSQSETGDPLAGNYQRNTVYCVLGQKLTFWSRCHLNWFRRDWQLPNALQSQVGPIFGLYTVLYLYFEIWATPRFLQIGPLLSVIIDNNFFIQTICSVIRYIY